MNLYSLLEETDASAPSAPAVIDPEGGSEATLGRAELRAKAHAVAAQLVELGVRRGDCVGVYLPNWSDTLAWQFGAALCGAHVIGINTRYNTAEVAHVLDKARPLVLAVAAEFRGLDLGGVLRAAASLSVAPAPSIVVVAAPGAEAPQELSGYDVGGGVSHGVRIGAQSGVPVTGRGADLAVAFTTSGSTGRPKLAAHTGEAVVRHAANDATRLGITPGDVVLCALPLSGVFGFSTAFAALAGGATALLLPAFDADVALQLCERFGVTHIVGGDDLVARIADRWRESPRDLSGLRWVGMADFLGRSAELARWAETEIGATASGVYGSSEVFALTAFWDPSVPTAQRWCGGGQLVSPDIEARAVDVATGEHVALGAEGELQLRGYNVVDAYLGDEGEGARSFTADGWFRTGDLVRFDRADSFTYVCRLGDALRLRGFLVDPAEIEQRLSEHPAVGTAKVVGATAADGHTRAIGFVVLDLPGSVDSAGLVEWCADTLAKFKVPHAVHIVEEMPMTSGVNGSKIRAAQLREWAQQRTDHAVSVEEVR